MIDFARITVKAGAGGNGSGSRRQIKGKRYAKADGGDGGRGGDVYLAASGDLNTLEPYRFVKNYQAQNGQNGFSNLKRGAGGQDLVLKVPVGTVVQVHSRQSTVDRTFDSRLSPPFWASLASGGTFDLLADGQRVLVARAGEGGRGNAHLRDEFGRRPRIGERGQPGEELNLTLELKLIADVGLIGLPNAGKSTLLSALTAAKPKIAAYPFTTLEPNLGVMTTDYRLQTTAVDSSQSTVDSKEAKKELSTLDFRLPPPFWASLASGGTPDSRLVLADIPGLIEGASQGRGLGDLFLRHIERTKILVHLIDITSPNIWLAYQTVRSELKAYSKELTKKKEIIVLNKIDILRQQEAGLKLDLVDQKAAWAAQEEFKKHRKKVLLISAEKGKGLEELVKKLYDLLVL